MAVKRSIWGSKAEEKGFRSIETTWGDQYRIVPQMPFSALFTPDPDWRGSTSNLFFKTSVDYVVCDERGHLLLAIDFDGMGRGFDCDGRYVQVEETDEHRKQTFVFKLRYAQKPDNEFPYHIVASNEFLHVGPDIELTIVDGMIGNILAQREFHNRASITNFSRLSDVEDLEFDCYMEHNKMLRKARDLKVEIHELTGQWYPGVSCRRWDSNQADGSPEYFIRTPFGEVSEVVRIRNVAYVASLQNDIGQVMVYSKLLRRLRGGFQKSFNLE